MNAAAIGSIRPNGPPFNADADFYADPPDALPASCCKLPDVPGFYAIDLSTGSATLLGGK